MPTSSTVFAYTHSSQKCSTRSVSIEPLESPAAAAAAQRPVDHQPSSEIALSSHARTRARARSSVARQPVYLPDDSK